ncbi:MAG: class I SAM-dependent methyltransferase [Caldilineaceae bacterium]
MTQPQFDPAAYKATQRAQWNQDAAAWQRWTPTLEHWAAPVTQQMLALAAVTAGDHVLDIATGAGEPALSAAQLVGNAGHVLATDLSAAMVQFTQENATAKGLSNLTARVMDGEQLELPDHSVDVVLCRFGLIYMPNAGQALAEWWRVLKPGGRLAVAVFTTPDKNQWGSIPAGIILQHAQLPPPQPGRPGPFSLGGEGVLAAALANAGFEQVSTTAFSMPLRMTSAKECVTFERESFGAFNQMMFHLSPKERAAAWDAVEVAMRQFEGPDGFAVSCEPLIGVAKKG